MAVSGLFLTVYARLAGLVELLRVPDAIFATLASGWLTMGHVLSLPMLAAGLLLLGWPTARRGDQRPLVAVQVVAGPGDALLLPGAKHHLEELKAAVVKADTDPPDRDATSDEALIEPLLDPVGHALESLEPHRAGRP